MALIPVLFTASTKDIAERSYEQGILKYPGFCFIEDTETIAYVSSDNELHYIKGENQVTEIKFENSRLNFYFKNKLLSSFNIIKELRDNIGLPEGNVSEMLSTKTDKVLNAVSGNLSALDENGNLVDSGKSISDFDISGAAQTVKTETLKYIGTLSDEYTDVISYIKHVSDTSDTKSAQALTDAKTYTNNKISELVNGAPETADTLKELSDLVDKNKGIIDSLNTLVSKKADAEETSKSIEAVNNKTLTVDSNGTLIFE